MLMKTCIVFVKKQTLYESKTKTERQTIPVTVNVCYTEASM